MKLMSAVAISFSQPPNKSIEAEKLLKQLLECVQDCQKRYGGKTELATELDSCIVGLCLSLEEIFLHGLKSQPTEQQFTLKQVSAIVANSLSTGSNEVLSFWPFIKKHLTKHEQERYATLKHIWTDTGCGRAWIRSTLNEHSLERYIHTILCHPRILNEYYESWAILRDEEKNSMLPNMAGGLGSILFAISIDKPELNSSFTQKSTRCKNKVEPIIQTPVPAADHKVKKKKQKVSRQYISFDDDSESSTSLADVNQNNKNIKRKTGNLAGRDSSVQQQNELKNKKKSPLVVKLPTESSMAASEPPETFQSTKPTVLTPVNNIEIGELTPISMEVNTNFGSPDSNDILEIPTDISAVLTAFEVKNEEELRKKDEEIKSVVKDNERLQEQVKKYVSAIQMLREDKNEELDEVLKGLELEKHTDYKKEAKLFEQKLIQIAEMHAELIDFNSVLQHKLAEKEALVDKLRNELETLKGPLPTYDIEGSDCVQVWIPSAFLTGSGSNSHHIYQIFLRAGNDEWNIYRRYAQFHALHTDLKKMDPTVATFDFPPKKSIRRKNSALAEDRRKRLQLYLRRVIMHWPELSLCSNRQSLEQHLSFFKDEEQPIKKNMDSPRSQTRSQSSVYSGL